MGMSTATGNPPAKSLKAFKVSATLIGSLIDPLIPFLDPP